MARTALAKAIALVLLLGATALAASVFGLPDVESVRAYVARRGALGPVVYVVIYALLALMPAPKGALTAVGGVLFGFWGGAALALGAALIGAFFAFALARLLGREFVERLTKGRLEAVHRLLEEHGTVSVIALRLVPVFPYTAINYAAGLSEVRRRDYVVGSAVGMVPGSLAYSALGAYGSDPESMAWVLAGLLGLVVVGVHLGRRITAGEASDVR